MQFSDKYDFLMKYFKNGIESKDKNIAHSILFYGNDVQSQYDVALEISRLLNCTGDKSETCDCLNCRWIRENKHPAVMTITKVDNKEADDTTKTVISASQVKMVKDNLSLTSDYHRVIIFADRDNSGNLCGLNEKVFPETAANALLKTFEEPPKNTTFFFLTKNKSDIISTIVSRSQCFFVPSEKVEQLEFDKVKDTVENYFTIDRNDVLDFNDRLFGLTKEYDPLDILTEFQNYILSTVKNNLDNNVLKIKLISDLKKIETARNQVKLGIQVQTVIETLCFELIL
ncbi:MAG: hypothetical protein LKG27_08375 [Clostridiaceae bacterium]|jgi:hypothetical protein|nr:hypothetical protein [Clostridiaceae bacterium]